MNDTIVNASGKLERLTSDIDLDNYDYMVSLSHENLYNEKATCGKFGFFNDISIQEINDYLKENNWI